MEGWPCLQDHAVHRHAEYPPASWRVAICEVTLSEYAVNNIVETYVVGSIRVIIDATEERS